MPFAKTGKTLSVLAILTVFSAGLVAPVYGKETAQKTEPSVAAKDTPKPTPSPTPAPKKTEKPKKEKSGSAGAPSSGGY